MANVNLDLFHIGRDQPLNFGILIPSTDAALFYAGNGLAFVSHVFLYLGILISFFSLFPNAAPFAAATSELPPAMVGNQLLTTFAYFESV